MIEHVALESPLCTKRRTTAHFNSIETMRLQSKPAFQTLLYGTAIQQFILQVRYVLGVN